MALKFNSFMTSANGLPAAMNANAFSSLNRLYVYPSSVAYPSSCPSSVTAGSILLFDNISFTLNGGTFSMLGSKTATASASGTLSWWLLTSAITPQSFGLCGDSITTAGNGGIVIVSTLTPTTNTSVTLSSLSITIS